MAPRSKLGKLLTCFYCGRRSTIRFDGRIQHFDCAKCDATNYLDAAGDIADPPVATTTAPNAPTYARRSLSPSYRPTEQIFCRKCTTNQHLVVSSLAQYLPDDPDDPEYAERERGYYKFRRNLEKRYPQCCNDCEPKVRTQLGKANYTAKTDWLRRQLDYSTQTRVLLTKTGANYAASAGKWIWTTSWVLQILWHLMLIQQAAITSNELDKKSWAIFAARVAGLFTDRLSTPEHVIYWSFWLTIWSSWWNPRWVESWRGFMKHLYGFKTYYTYQVMIVAFKFLSYMNVSLLNKPRAQRVSVQVVAHSSMAIFMCFLYRFARGSIRTDNKQLWLPRPGSLLAATPGHMQSNGAPPEPAENGEKTMADVLDDILNEPNTQRVVESPPPTARTSPVNKFNQMPMIGARGSFNPFDEPTPTPTPHPQRYVAEAPLIDEFDHVPTYVNHFDHMPTVGSRSSYNPAAPSLGPNPFKSLASTPTPRPGTSGSNMGFGGLSLADEPQSQTRPQTRAQTRSQQQQRFHQPRPSYEQEMEWSPTQSQHRAFATYRPGQPTEKRGFNETPTSDNPNKVFWAKIPPKPTTPAQRLFNPPGRPVIRTIPAETASTKPLKFQGSTTSGSTTTGKMMFRKLEPANARPPGTVFAQPSFLPPPPSDERDSLAEAFTRSFSLSDGSEARRGGGAGTNSGGGTSLALKLKYSVFGLCVAIVAQQAYQYVLSTWM